MELILASTSPARANILHKLKLPFATIAPDVDETPLPNETPQALVQRLAHSKANAVTAPESAFVIGSDQVATFNGKIIGKPHTREKAFAQLSEFSGESVLFYTGLALRHNGKTIVHLEPFEVVFRPLSPSEINRYLDLEDVLKCAGAIKSEGLGIHLFKQLNGRDPNALMGLPVIALNELMAQFGKNLLLEF